MKIGIVLPNWIGDVVMATPTLRAIRNHFGPGAELAGIMQPYVSEVLAGTKWLDRRFKFDRGSGDARLRGTGLLRRLHAWNPDTMLLLTNSLWAGALAWMSGATQRVGYARNGRGPLLTTRLEYPRGRGSSPPSAVDTYLELAYAIGCSTATRNLELGTSSRDELAADLVWNKFGFGQHEPVIVLNTGGAYGAAKDWPTENFARLAKRISLELGYAVLIICGPAERENAARIERLAGDPRVRSLAEERVGIGLSKACIRRGRLVVTTDSGPRHFAAAFGVPAVSLFGPTDAAWSVNYHPREVALQKQVDCGPCGKRICPLFHHKCMRELSTERVFAAVQAQLWTRDEDAA